MELVNTTVELGFRLFYVVLGCPYNQSNQGQPFKVPEAKETFM